MENKRFYLTGSSYSKEDSLYIVDYILFGLDEQPLNRYEKVWLDEDSLYNKFKYSFKLLELPVQFDSISNNQLNQDFVSNHYLKYKKIDKNYILELAGKHKSRTVIIPILVNLFRKYYQINSVGRDTYPYYICDFSLAIFIVKNNEIIYYKQNRHVEKVDGEYYPYKYEDFYIPIPQKHWDGLVKEVMREYIERSN